MAQCQHKRRPRAPSRAAPDPARQKPLAILAGGGSMPIHVAEAAVAQGRPVHIVALKRSASEAVRAFPHTWVNIGQVGRILSAFKQNGCKELVIIGSVRRPNFGELRVDWGTVINLNGLLKLRTAGGDSSLLGRITTFFEAKGMHVSGAHEIAPDLLAARGPLGRLKPNQPTEADIELGRKAVATFGALDIGQAVVVARGHIIAVEAAEGTDAVVERCKDLKKWSLGRGSPRVGVLVKCAKPGQDRRIDLPSIGPETVRRVAEARLTGIAVAAGDVLIAEREEVVRLADRLGIFIVGITPPVSGAQGRTSKTRRT